MQNISYVRPPEELLDMGYIDDVEGGLEMMAVALVVILVVGAVLAL